MSDTVAIAPLRVANEAFLVASMIERCPKTMMLRELVVNGLEAAEHAVSGGQRVVITARKLDGVRKLCIWNTGLGLTAAELLQITDLASSLRKINSLEQNFGMGAKVASLPSNRHGLRYRSCQAGRVSEVVLGYRGGIYGRLHRGAGGQEVVDATDHCSEEDGYDLSFDWTEVLLSGNAADQDTVADPYGSAPRVEASWLTHYLTNRFFRLPDGVTLSLDADVTGGAGPREFRGLDAQRSSFGQTETKSTASGVKIHYYFDPPAGGVSQSAVDAVVPRPSRGGVVYRGEVYDVREGDQWLADAPVYGIPFGAKYCSVFVELPDDYLVWPEAYRQFLRLRGGQQRQIFLSDFGPLVRSHLPEWLARLIRSFGPQQAHYLGEISDELKALLAELGVLPEAQRSSIPGASLPSTKKVTAPEAPATPEKLSKTPPMIPPAEPTPKPKPKVFERPPEIIGLRSPDMIAERALVSRAARFYPQSHQVFVNLTYPSVELLAMELQREHGGLSAPEFVRQIAAEVSEWCITRKVTHAIVYSLAKKSAGWRPEDITRSQSPECLSLVADDWPSLLDLARARFEDALSAHPQPSGRVLELVATPAYH